MNEILNGSGGKLTAEQRRDIDDEGYHAGYSMRVPSWSSPYRERTMQNEIWKEGWKKGREDRETRMREGLDE